MDIFVITKWTPSQLAWNASERSQLDLHWERHLRDLLETSQKRWLFCNVFRTSQIPVKKDGFFVTSLRHLKNILKRCLLCDVFKMSRAHLKKDIYSNIRAYLWGVSKTSRQVFVIFQRYPKNMVWCDFRRVITMSDKIQKVSLETRKKWNVFWEQCKDINQVCHEYQWADISVGVLESQRLSKPNSRGIIYYF